MNLDLGQNYIHPRNEPLRILVMAYSLYSMMPQFLLFHNFVM